MRVRRGKSVPPTLGFARQRMALGEVNANIVTAKWHLLEWGGKRSDEIENPPKVSVWLSPSFDSPGALSRSPLWKWCWSLPRRPPRWRRGTPSPCSVRGCGNSQCAEGPGRRAPLEGRGEGGACRWRRIWREPERRRRIPIRRGCCLSLEEIKQVMLLQEWWNRWGLSLYWKRENRTSV